jgi:hypothetical protein
MPLNGVDPTIISKIRIPRVHQSTAAVCPIPWITSGQIYSSVPTKELVLVLAVQAFVSIF